MHSPVPEYEIAMRLKQCASEIDAVRVLVTIMLREISMENEDGAGLFFRWNEWYAPTLAKVVQGMLDAAAAAQRQALIRRLSSNL